MQINFRQGIIGSQSLPKFLQKNSNSNIDFDASTSPTILNFADGSSNYLLYESTSIANAWSIPSGQACWLYWDISTEDASRSFGYTFYNPFSTVAPTNPQLNQMFFNTSTFKYQSWTGQYWRDVIRVIAGSVDASGNIITQSSGSQINSYQSGISDVIVFDDTNRPIKNYTPVGFEFLNKSTIINFKNNAKDSFNYSRLIQAHGTVTEDITKHYCVTWKDYNTLELADPTKIGQPAFALVEKHANTGDIVSLVSEGFVTNRTDWNWPYDVHTALYVGVNGLLTPNFDSSFQYSIQKVGYVVSPNTIYLNFNLQYSKNVSIVPTVTPSTTPTITPTSSILPSPTPTITPTLTPTLLSLYAGGSFTNIGGTLGLDSLNSDGTLNTSFTNIQLDAGSVNYMIQTTDTKIYVVGSFSTVGGGYNYLLRLNSNGTLDTTYTPPTFDGSINYIQQTLDNKLYVLGNFSIVDGYTNYESGMVRLNSDGTLDTSFTNVVFDVYPSTIHQTIDGKIYIGGSFTTVDGVSYPNLARLNSDGTLDTSFTNLAFNDKVTSLYQTIDNKIYVMGYFSIIGGNSYTNLARLNSDGTLDTSFVAITFNGNVDSLYQTSDNKIYVVGSFTTVNTVTYQNIARLNSDGTIDSTLGNLQLASEAYSIMQTGDGKIYVSGALSVSIIGTAGVFNIIRLNSDGTYDYTFNDSLRFNNTITHILQATDGTLYIGSNGRSRTYNCIARLYSTGIIDNSFEYLGIPIAYSEVDVLLRSRVDNKIYMGGQFTNIGSSTYDHLARLNSDGTLDTTFTNYFISSAVLDMYQTIDNKIYFGGDFITANSSTYDYLARLNTDGTFDTSMVDLGLNSTVNSICQTIDTKIYVGGSFDNTGSVSYNCLVRLNSDGTLDTSFIAINFPQHYAIFSIMQSLDGKIYVGGNFSSIGGSYSYVARLNSDGTLDTSFTDLMFNNTVNTIYQTIDNKIYIGGIFSTVGGINYNHVVRLNSDGSLDTTFVDLSLNTEVNVIKQSSMGPIFLATDDTIITLNSNGTLNNVGLSSNYSRIYTLLIND